MSAQDNDPKPDGKAFDDFFDSIGSKAEQVDSKNNNATTAITGGEQEDDQRVVDEIESLCMNCHANVSRRILVVNMTGF